MILYLSFLELARPSSRLRPKAQFFQHSMDPLEYSFMDQYKLHLMLGILQQLLLLKTLLLQLQYYHCLHWVVSALDEVTHGKDIGSQA